MRRFSWIAVLPVFALLPACTPGAAVRPADTAAEKLFVNHRFAAAYMAPNLSSESTTIVLDLEGGSRFVPTEGEFFKPLTDAPPDEVKRQLERGAKVFVIEEGGTPLGYMVMKENEFPEGLMVKYIVFTDPQAGTWTVRSETWYTNDV